MATAPSWITFDKISGTGNATVQVKAVENIHPFFRESSFSVKTVDGKIEKVIKVLQNPLKTPITITITVEHNSMGSPSEGWFEAQYTITAEADAPVTSGVTITVRLHESSRNSSVTIPSGTSGNTAEEIIGNNSGSFSDTFDIVSHTPYSDLYHNYIVQ